MPSGTTEDRGTSSGAAAGSPQGAAASSGGPASQWCTGGSFLSMWRELTPVGRHPDSGGYRRYAWSAADLDCRTWFRAQAEARGLTYETDRNGNQLSLIHI